MLIHYPSHRTYNYLLSILTRKPKGYFIFLTGKHYLDITESEYNLLKEKLPNYAKSGIKKTKIKIDDPKLLPTGLFK
jgi:hypothetical protein